MITLTFNSTAKTVTITREGFLTEYQDVPTVKVREGFYRLPCEVISPMLIILIPLLTMHQ